MDISVENVIYPRPGQAGSGSYIFHENNKINFQKHLGLYLDEKLNLNYHIKEKKYVKQCREFVLLEN